MTQTVAIPTRRQHRKIVLAPVLGLVALGICALAVVGIVGSRIGVGAVIVGALCALLPVGPVVAAFLWVDRWEPEPPRMLLLAFLWGAGFAALSALLINSSAALAAESLVGEGSGDVLGATVSAPIVEEAMKGLFLVGLLVWRRREIDGIVDGIVYAGLVAAGFAFTENILYLGRAFAEQPVAAQGAGVATVFVIRGLFSPFAHPLFTSMTGIGVGIAAGTRNAGSRVAWVFGGYVLAVTLHALWNGAATFGGSSAFIVIYGTVMVPAFIALIVLIVWQRRREQRIVAEQLPGFAAAGWIAPSEIELLASLAGRRGWRSAVRRRSGKAAAAAVADYQAAVTEMAFLRGRIARGSVRDSAAVRQEEMLLLLKKARAKALGNPDAYSAAWRQQPPPGWVPPPALPHQPVPVGQHHGAAPQPGPYPPRGAPPRPPLPGHGPLPGPGSRQGPGPVPGYAPRPGYGPPPAWGPAPGTPSRPVPSQRPPSQRPPRQGNPHQPPPVRPPGPPPSDPHGRP